VESYGAAGLSACAAAKDAPVTPARPVGVAQEPQRKHGKRGAAARLTGPAAGRVIDRRCRSRLRAQRGAAQGVQSLSAGGAHSPCANVAATPRTGPIATRTRGPFCVWRWRQAERDESPPASGSTSRPSARRPAERAMLRNRFPSSVAGATSERARARPGAWKVPRPRQQSPQTGAPPPDSSVRRVPAAARGSAAGQYSGPHSVDCASRAYVKRVLTRLAVCAESHARDSNAKRRSAAARRTFPPSPKIIRISRRENIQQRRPA
jgi:hypothetical protein